MESILGSFGAVHLSSCLSSHAFSTFGGLSVHLHFDFFVPLFSSTVSTGLTCVTPWGDKDAAFFIVVIIVALFLLLASCT